MKFVILLTFLTEILIHNTNSTQVRNSEGMIISLGNLDESIEDLEMIPENKLHTITNEKMKEFHNYVKNSKIMSHPWEKLVIKNAEYGKSEESYQKLIQDLISRLHGFNVKRSPKPELNLNKQLDADNLPNIDKRQLSDLGTVQEDNNDDDDDDDDQDENGISPQLSNTNDLKIEYEKQIVADEEKEKAFKYSDKGKPEESINEAFQKIIDVKTPENCSNITGFGIQSVECVIKNYKSHEMTRKEALVTFIKIFLIWVDVYLCIALPLWCIKGWGCCCITWKYCHPKELVKEVQHYVTENPPGVYVNEQGEEEHYAPTLREKELYDNINRKILSM